MAARETAPYPAASFSPIASPRRAGPTRSIFMITVVDQHSPWLMPNSTLANTTHSQLGASITRNGTGKPINQPATRMRLRPILSLMAPASRVASALITPKLTMNDRIAVRDAIRKSCSASSGMTARSRPTIPPTKALMTTSSVNCCQFAQGRGERGRPPYCSRAGGLGFARCALLDLAACLPPVVDALGDDRQVPITTMLQDRRCGGGALAMTAMGCDEVIAR